MSVRIGPLTVCALFLSTLAVGGCARHQSSQKISTRDLQHRKGPQAASSANQSACASQHLAPPSVTATAQPRVPPTLAKPVIAAPEAPKIFSVQISTTVLHPGDVVTGDVITSNVTSVEARVCGDSVDTQKTGPGTFPLRYRLRDLQFS